MSKIGDLKIKAGKGTDKNVDWDKLKASIDKKKQILDGDKTVVK